MDLCECTFAVRALHAWHELHAVARAAAKLKHHDPMHGLCARRHIKLTLTYPLTVQTKVMR